eukprot:6004095-Pyramimonas_sp.AAC.1
MHIEAVVVIPFFKFCAQGFGYLDSLVCISAFVRKSSPLTATALLAAVATHMRAYWLFGRCEVNRVAVQSERLWAR